jgi:signal transduction histidine kinase
MDRNSDKIHITVKDNGIGIRPEHKERIFETFFSTKPDSGTGLGLKVVEKYVSNYGGTISFDSKYGEGTEFVITLPAAK